MKEHRKAIESDLMQRGFCLDDIGRSLPWSALNSFISNIGLDSALVKELEPEIADWGTVWKTNLLLADIFDILNIINANIVAIGSHKAAKQTKPYPRPGDEKKGEHYGKGAVSVPELRKMFAGKRRKHGEQH